MCRVLYRLRNRLLLTTLLLLHSLESTMVHATSYLSPVSRGIGLCGLEVCVLTHFRAFNSTGTKTASFYLHPSQVRCIMTSIWRLLTVVGQCDRIQLKWGPGTNEKGCVHMFWRTRPVSKYFPVITAHLRSLHTLCLSTRLPQLRHMLFL